MSFCNFVGVDTAVVCYIFFASFVDIHVARYHVTIRYNVVELEKEQNKNLIQTLTLKALFYQPIE